jgi:hypothetical protein
LGVHDASEPASYGKQVPAPHVPLHSQPSLNVPLQLLNGGRHAYWHEPLHAVATMFGGAALGQSMQPLPQWRRSALVL